MMKGVLESARFDLLPKVDWDHEALGVIVGFKTRHGVAQAEQIPCRDGQNMLEERKLSRESQQEVFGDFIRSTMRFR